ncbi:putative protein phosphatase 2C 55 [Chlorella vulgaris]
MARVAGLRRALAACAHSVSALQQGSSNSLRPAAISSLVETAPSTSYAAPQTGWLRRQRASNASQLSAAAAAAAATEGSAAAAQPGTALYQIVVVTGDVRGAGSPAPAVVTLVGTEGESEQYLIGDSGEDRGFERATKKSYSLQTHYLGQLQRVHVQQLPSLSDGGGVGWFLDRIDVTGPEGRHWTFPCSAWLGRSNHPAGLDGDHERNLAPCASGVVGPPVVAHSMMEPNYRLLGAPLHVEAAATALPHPEKAAAGLKGVNRKGGGYGGEDAYFYCTNRNGITALGVADGVYMWRDKGIDAGMYSRRLMEFARHAVDLGTTDVLRVLQFAAKRLRLEGVLGSCTACVVLIDHLQGRLAAANLGDSGFLVIGRRRQERTAAAGGGGGGGGSSRGSLEIKYRSPQQEHSFGYPYQLGHYPEADQPEDAMLTTMPLSPGDIVVLGSDGLWDNVSEEELLAEVEKDVVEGVKAPVISQRLAFLAFESSLDKGRETPYSMGASEAFDMVYSGGKSDDITVM